MSRQTVVLVVTVILCDAVQARTQAQDVDAYRASESKRKCETHATCHHNEYCDKLYGDDTGFCLCQNHAVPFMELCIPAARKLGDKCVESIQCTKKLGDTADCINKECKCNTGSHSVEGKCHKFVKIGRKCAGPNDCYSASGTPVSCKEGICQCLEGYYPNDDRSDCVLHIKLGKECTRTDDCVANYSTCTNTCTCFNGFIPSSDEQRCLPLVHKLGTANECEEDAQCNKELPNTVCRNKLCSCINGNKVQEGKCVESKDLGTYCDSDAFCAIDESECRRDICACKDGWVNAADNTRRCIKVAEKFNAACDETIQCTKAFGDNAICTKEGLCDCKDGYFSEMKCWKNKKLGSSCERSVECHIAKHKSCQRMECSSKSGKCVCKQGYKVTNGECSGVSPSGSAGGVSIATAMCCSLLILIVSRIFGA